MKSKKFIIVLLVLVVIICSLGFFVFKRPDVVLKDNLSVSINDKVVNLDFISDVKYGELVSKSEIVDSSSLGKKSVSVSVKNIFGKKFDFSFDFFVIDSQSPVIVGSKDLEITEGDSIDLLEGISVRDNSGESLYVNIIGDYDFNVPGEYKVFYVARDSSGNESREEISLFVKKKATFNSNGVRDNMTDRSFVTSKGFDAVVKDGVLYVEGTLIANKSYYLPYDYGDGLTDETLSAFNVMRDDAKKLGLNIYISSGFRSYSTQRSLYNRYVNKSGKSEADTYSARAGHSEHQTGLAFDVNDISQSFQYTSEGKWLAENAYKYGFILRYPKGKTDETGYIYEPWHFRYVGVDLASKLYDDGNWITLEDYFGITSVYDY